MKTEKMTAEDYYARGLAKQARKAYAGAIADLSKAIELDPTKAHYYYFRGRAKDWRSDNSGAKADYKKAHELDPTRCYQ